MRKRRELRRTVAILALAGLVLSKSTPAWSDVWRRFPDDEHRTGQNRGQETAGLSLHQPAPLLESALRHAHEMDVQRDGIKRWAEFSSSSLTQAAQTAGRGQRRAIRIAMFAGGVALVSLGATRRGPSTSQTICYDPRFSTRFGCTTVEIPGESPSAEGFVLAGAGLGLVLVAVLMR